MKPDHTETSSVMSVGDNSQYLRRVGCHPNPTTTVSGTWSLLQCHVQYVEAKVRFLAAIGAIHLLTEVLPSEQASSNDRNSMLLQSLLVSLQTDHLLR